MHNSDTAVGHADCQAVETASKFGFVVGTASAFDFVSLVASVDVEVWTVFAFDYVEQKAWPVGLEGSLAFGSLPSDPAAVGTLGRAARKSVPESVAVPAPSDWISVLAPDQVDSVFGAADAIVVVRVGAVVASAPAVVASAAVASAVVSFAVASAAVGVEVDVGTIVEFGTAADGIAVASSERVGSSFQGSAGNLHTEMAAYAHKDSRIHIQILLPGIPQHFPGAIEVQSSQSRSGSGQYLGLSKEAVAHLAGEPDLEMAYSPGPASWVPAYLLLGLWIKLRHEPSLRFGAC